MEADKIGCLKCGSNYSLIGGVLQCLSCGVASPYLPMDKDKLIAELAEDLTKARAKVAKFRSELQKAETKIKELEREHEIPNYH